MRKMLTPWTVSLMALLTLPAAAASPFSRLHVFNPVKGDGADPLAGVIGDDAGNLYGTTAGGGVYIEGTVFKLSPPQPESGAWTETLLHQFPATATDGSQPKGSLVVDGAGALYGTTSTVSSGATISESGTVFKLEPPPAGSTVWVETILHTFSAASSGPDGSMPAAGLVFGPDGALYGTTTVGGPQGAGTVFKMTPPAPGQTAWTETVLYAFSGGSTDGSLPVAKLIMDTRGALYGTTEYGGGAANCFRGCGTVFKLTPPAAGRSAWTESLLHIFTTLSGGDLPTGDLVMGRTGALYGTTPYGGPSKQCVSRCGIVFQLTPPAPGTTLWPFTIIYGFTGTPDGAHPTAGLTIDRSGNLYGSTPAGGFLSTGCDGGCGAVFKLTPPAPGQANWTESVMAPPTRIGGYHPDGDLFLQTKGKLVGVTERGPVGNDRGTVFEVRFP